MIQTIRAAVFKYRSYLPIPFLIVMLFYQDANIWSLPGGAVVVILGELIRLWGVSWAGSETRTTGPVGGTYLIISGPFAYVRNPLYFGNMLIYTGFGIMSFALFPYLQVAAFFWFYFQYLLIVQEEEGYLGKRFGAEYETYTQNVRRFFPRFTPYKGKNVEQPPFNLQAGLRSERRTLQAIVIVAVLLISLKLIRVLG